MPTQNSRMTDTSWSEAVFRVLKNGNVTQVAFVPDAGLSDIIGLAQRDPAIRDLVLTTEEEGVAIACGAWLGGQRAVLLMQSSGVGNCVNMFSLLTNCQFPFLTLVAMRGEYAELNPWQVPMGRATQQVLELMGIQVLRADKAEEVEDMVSAALDAVFEANDRVAVLLGQKLIGREKWERE